MLDSGLQVTAPTPDQLPAHRLGLDPGRHSGARRPASADPAFCPPQGRRPKLSPARLGQLARAMAGTAEHWRPVARFTADRRWFLRLALASDHEIWLLTWLPGQHTGFHDHGNAAGAFAVAEGELRESLASVGSSRVRHRVAGSGSVTRFGGRHLHDVSNGSARPAISVHAYSPPLSAMRRYEMTASGLALMRTDRAELDW